MNAKNKLRKLSIPKPIIVTSNYQSINKREGDQPKVMYFVVAEEATREPIACQTE